MSNTIKYSESTEQRALNKGNWWIGTGDSNKGPSDVTGYYAGVTPPPSGYTIYTKREDNLPSIFVAQNDQELINLTNLITESNFSTVQQCFNYYQTQDDMVCLNREIENIVTDGLVLNLDAGYVPSYPTSGTTWYDLSGNGNDGTLINGPIYSGGSIVFDGADDYIDTNQQFNFSSNSSFSVSCWVFQKSAQWVNGDGPGYIGKTRAQTHSWSLGVLDGGDLNFEVRGNGSRYQARTQTPLQEWFFVVGTYNIGEGLLYVNGVLKDSFNYPLSDGNFDANRIVEIGRRASDSSRVMDGNISIAQIYNRALSATEVLQNYNAQKSRFGL